MLDFLPEIVIGILLIAVSSIATYVVSRLLHKNQTPIKKVKCQATYCHDLLVGPSDAFGNTLQVIFDGQVLERPVLMNYQIKSIGNQVITDCRVQICTDDTDRIIRKQILVSNELQCDRLNVLADSPNNYKFTWSHINPGDQITIALLINPCEDAECVRFNVDAEGLIIDNKNMQSDCSMRLSCNFTPSGYVLQSK